MTLTTQPLTIISDPDTIEGLLEILQRLHQLAGNATRDIGGYLTFRDGSYLTSAQDELDVLKRMLYLTQCGLMTAQTEGV